MMEEEIQGNGFLMANEHFVPTIKVVGTGGGGNNVISKMMNMGVQFVDFIACNTDLKALNATKAHIRMELGKEITHGLGAGAHPEIGAKAAEENRVEIENMLEGADMIFIAAGMGGGTGIGLAPVIAEIARQKEILTVGVVTLPFYFEGKKRMRIALEGVENLRKYTDTLLVIPNDKLLDATTENTSLLDAFHLVDEVLMNAIQGVTDLINNVGIINVDFADVKTIMQEMGIAVIGKGVASGENRMLRATHNAIYSPLMRDTDIRGAKGILVHILGPEDMGMIEINEAVSAIEDIADEDVNLIFGASPWNNNLDQVMVTVIATGLNQEKVNI